ncbi:MAG: PBECR2 nuclease fold domain-containing protein [Methylophilus sp.]
MATNPAQLPFKEAINFYRDKIKLPTSGWTDIWEQQHSKAFVVAGAQSDSLLQDLYNAIQDAKQSGGGYSDFKERFQEITTRHGWSYNGAPNWRSRVIYDTNITQAYNAGRYVQMQAVKHLRPYWQYRHTSIENPRLNHKSWDGLILPADDAWWDTHMPQNGWGCKCRIDSLSRIEAQREWTKAGKSGPDTAPEIVWEDRIIGKNGSNPRIVTTPQGIDPGFGYNVGKAYLEPLTIPPLTGYDAVLKERGVEWPTGFKIPGMPKPTVIDKAAILPKDIAPEQAVTDFLDVFGADMQTGAVFTDAAGSSLAITKALFTDGKGDFKWLAKENKADRLQYINLLAMTLIEPDEIWWVWVQDHKNKGSWRLKRRYLRSFEVDGTNEYAVTVFEWGKTGWTGATTFMTTQPTKPLKEAYFDKQRAGRLVFKK